MIGELVKPFLEYSGCYGAYYLVFVWGVPTGMAWSQVKVARGLTRLSGERAFVSRFYIIDVTRVRLFVNNPIVGLQIEERFVRVGSLLCLFLEEVVFKIDLSASLSFLMKIRG